MDCVEMGRSVRIDFRFHVMRKVVKSSLVGVKAMGAEW